MIRHLVRIANQRRRTPGIPRVIILSGAAISLPSTTSLRRVRVSPLDIFDIPLCRFPYFSRELKHLAPLGRRHPLDWLVKSRRNIELDDPCHSILRCVFFRQLEESNSDAKVCVDCKWLKINQVAPGPGRCSRCRPEAQPRSIGGQTRRLHPPLTGNQVGQRRNADFAPDRERKSWRSAGRDRDPARVGVEGTGQAQRVQENFPSARL